MASSLDRPFASRGKPSALHLASSSFSAPSALSSDSASDVNDLILDNDDEDSSSLPFPQALPRADFVTPVFDPAAYLSALPHRHQTLDDLAADLRDRSTAISAELLELVNANSAAFLSLGTSLRGGDDRVEDVRVSLLGFKRSLVDVRTKVAARRTNADNLTTELRCVRKGIECGRKMVEAGERLASVEERLALVGKRRATERPRQVDANEDSDGDDDDDDDDSEDEDDDDQIPGLVASPPSRLMRLARDCMSVERLSQSLPSGPFTHNIQLRLSNCRKTLLLDLSNALKESRKAGTLAQGRVVKYLAIYRTMGAQNDAVRILQT